MTYNGGPNPNQGPAGYPGQQFPTGSQASWTQGQQPQTFQGHGQPSSNPNNGKNGGNGAVVGAFVGGTVVVVMLGLLILAASNRSEPTAGPTTPSTLLEQAPTQPDPLISPGSAPEAETTTTTLLPQTRTVSWTSLTEGDCTNDRLLDATVVSLIEVSGCDVPHRFEVFAVVSPWDDDELFPGSDEARDTANVECDALFAGFYGAPSGTNGYQFITLYPNSELAWTTSKDIVCIIGDLAQTTTEGSLRNAAE